MTDYLEEAAAELSEGPRRQREAGRPRAVAERRKPAD